MGGYRLVPWQEEFALHLCRMLEVPSAICGWGWLEPDPNPFPRMHLRRKH